MSGSASILRTTDPAALPAALRGGVVAIGNFDGVHRGHQAVLGEACRIAAEGSLPVLALTFEPHPRTVFHPERPVARLTPAAMKARLLGALGFDAVIEHPFDRSFAAWSPDAFIERILVGSFAARHVVVGFDFQFGARRAGTAAYLARAAEASGFGVTCVDALADETGEAVSSSRIRDALAAGKAEAAARLLGYRWTFAAPVVGGQRLGRTLNYPTANMAPGISGLLMHGIYAVRFRRANGDLHDGVASYGVRPTFDNGEPLFETHLFDFDGDLYGETADISIFGFIRPELKFDGAAALVARMDEDAGAARSLLGKVEPLSALDAAVAF